MAYQARAGILRDVALAWIKDGGGILEVFFRVDLRRMALFLEGPLLMAQQTELAVAILEDPSGGLVLLMEEMAGRAPEKLMIVTVKILDDGGMAVAALEDNRMPLNFAGIALRLRLMTVDAFLDDRMDPRVLHAGQEEKRFVGTVTFDATGFGIFDMKELIMLGGIDLGEIPGPRGELAMTEEAALQRILPGHRGRRLRDVRIRARVERDMQVSRAVAVLALDADMDILFVQFEDVRMAFAADDLALINRFFRQKVIKASGSIGTPESEAFRPQSTLHNHDGDPND